MKQLARFLYNLYKPKGGLLLMDPLTIAFLASAGIQLASNVLPRVIGKKKREQRANEAGKSFDTDPAYGDVVKSATGQLGQGDPNTNKTLEAIRMREANTLSQARRSGGSANEVLAALQGIQRNSTDAEMNTIVNDTKFRMDARRYLDNTKLNLGGQRTNTQRANYAAKQQELDRQAKMIQGYSQAGGQLASDVGSLAVMKSMYGGK